ncbi:hypothetical protein ABCJ02_003103 [Salmonella enterica]
MDLKDIIGLSISVIAVIPVIFGAYKFFQDVSWFLPKATKYSHILEKYVEFLEPQEIEFLKVEMKRDIKRSVLAIKNIKNRNLVLYLRINSDLVMPLWRWAILAPHIQQKYGRFFIIYKGKYRLLRFFSKFMAIVYFIFGLMYSISISAIAEFLVIPGILMLIVCIMSAMIFWVLFPCKKKIEAYNAKLLRIDGDK